MPGGALDFASPSVRDHVVSLIEEAVKRYDCDGIELDFQRFPRFFQHDKTTPEQRIAALDNVVERVRSLLDAEGRRRGRRLVLGVRAPSGMGDFAPTPARAREIGADLAGWSRQRWIDFLVVSEWLFTRDTLGLGEWKRSVPGLDRKSTRLNSSHT